MVTVVEGEAGYVILTGCAYSGVLNMITAARKALPGVPIVGVVGGFYLHHEDDRAVTKVGETLLVQDSPQSAPGTALAIMRCPCYLRCLEIGCTTCIPVWRCFLY